MRSASGGSRARPPGRLRSTADAPRTPGARGRPRRAQARRARRSRCPCTCGQLPWGRLLPPPGRPSPRRASRGRKAERLQRPRAKAK
eukprot:12397055-Alexandrium_andersonii.AAC.1